MELSSKLSKNSFEISKRGATAIVLVGFQNQRILLLDDHYSSSVANQNAEFGRHLTRLVVRTRPRAIPLAMITMSDSWFFLLSHNIMVCGFHLTTLRDDGALLQIITRRVCIQIQFCIGSNSCEPM